MYSSAIAYSALSAAVMTSAGVTDIKKDKKRLPYEDLTKDTGTTETTISNNEKSPAKSDNKQSGLLSNGADGLKPPGLSYIALISKAIQSSTTKRMMLSEIYHWIAERYPYYQLKDKSWRNSIRHNLSLNECFVKCGRSENGKGNYWSIHPANMADFAKGDYRRRRARRRVRMCDDDLQRLCADVPEIEKPEPPAPSSPTVTHGGGYVPMVSTLVPSNFLSILGVEPTRSRDYWMTDSYYHGDPSGPPYHSHLHLGNQSANEKYYYAGCTDSSCREAQESSIHILGRSNDLDTVHVPKVPESTFSVNVNVNVSGNRSLQTFQPYYDPVCLSHQKMWSDQQ